MKAIRTQADDLGDDYAIATTIDCTAAEDMTRQEFKDEADVNVVLRKFGIGALTTMRHPMFGNYDENIQFQDMMASIEPARRAYDDLPLELRQRYPTLATFLTALEERRITIDIEPEEKTPPEPPVTEAKTPPVT